MSRKPIVQSLLAQSDTDAAIEHYLREAGADVVLRFIDAIEVAFRTIGHRPATGSPRHAHELNIPGLRSQRLKRFPYLLFYVERADRIDVWRVLHAQRDMAAWLGE